MPVANPDLFATQLFVVFSIQVCEKLMWSCRVFWNWKFYQAYVFGFWGFLIGILTVKKYLNL